MPRRQLTRYRAAAAELCASLAAHHVARTAYDLARDELEDARRSLVLASLPAFPERTTNEMREATHARATEAQARALRHAREGVRDAETRLEIVRTCERAEREALRVVARTGAE